VRSDKKIMQDHECMRQEFSCETAIIIKMIARNVLNVLCEDLQGKEKKIMGEEMVGNPLSFVNLHHFFMLNLNITQ